jgi:hypothetical protein
MDKTISMITVNLREVMKDHKSLRNEFFKSISFHKVKNPTNHRGHRENRGF